jgi:hypothetical protein
MIHPFHELIFDPRHLHVAFGPRVKHRNCPDTLLYFSSATINPERQSCRSDYGELSKRSPANHCPANHCRVNQQKKPAIHNTFGVAKRRLTV